MTPKRLTFFHFFLLPVQFGSSWTRKWTKWQWRHTRRYETSLGFPVPEASGNLNGWFRQKRLDLRDLTILTMNNLNNNILNNIEQWWNWNNLQSLRWNCQVNLGSLFFYTFQKLPWSDQTAQAAILHREISRNAQVDRVGYNSHGTKKLEESASHWWSHPFVTASRKTL